MGDIMGATHGSFSLGGGGFAMVNIAVVGGWLILAFLVGREYSRLAVTGREPGPRLVDPPEPVPTPSPASA